MSQTPAGPVPPRHSTFSQLRARPWGRSQLTGGEAPAQAGLVAPGLSPLAPSHVWHVQELITLAPSHVWHVQELIT